MANKVGKLIKEARTAAGMTQEQLAKKVKNTSASDISKAERGELKLSQDALKQIAKATGVTQKSLIDAAASSTYKSSSSGSSTKKTTSSTKKTTSSTTKKSTTSSTKKKTSSSSGKSSSSGSSMKVTATEKKLVEYYREADSDVKKKAMELLKTGKVSGGFGDIVSGLDDTIGSFVGSAVGDILFGKK